MTLSAPCTVRQSSLNVEIAGESAELCSVASGIGGTSRFKAGTVDDDGGIQIFRARNRKQTNAKITESRGRVKGPHSEADVKAIRTREQVGNRRENHTYLAISRRHEMGKVGKKEKGAEQKVPASPSEQAQQLSRPIAGRHPEAAVSPFA